MSPSTSRYLEEVKHLFDTGHAIEQAYRPALQRLMESIDDTAPVNDPKHSEHGAPDFVFLKRSNTDIIKGYAEAKDVDKNLDRVEKSEQMQRYAGYQNLFLTNYLEFRFFKNGEKHETISLGELKDGKLHLKPENGQRLMNELEAFMEQAPESIKSGKRLAKIMGAKARRIRDNVAIYLDDDAIDARELEKIYEMMKKLLVHDLDSAKFADMYAQTLVYGLFVARYGDSSLSTFSRSEARDLVPQSNPFLLHFFDHIAGAAFDKRLAKIVDELCDIFVVSDVQKIVHKHLRIADTTDDAKDPIIHFYEDFLQAYDPDERKRMGAYYTPIPVVKFIVRHIDKLLKEEFGIAKGLASTDTITQTVDTQPWRKKGERKDRLTREVTMPRVQVLDPAVGTATFLNETIKFIHESFKGQEGRWPSYVQDNLIKRLYGFELMMAPYTIAHLKLSMTLRETGVGKLDDRLNVFLTNTLEEGVPQQPDLFSFGLAEAVSEESRLAAEVKSEKPVMVVMGNPPYSLMSSNMGTKQKQMVQKYKKINGSKIVEKGALQLEKNLNDDYVKFISFAEDMVNRNGEGIVAMITNNSYVDNTTLRGLRHHLASSFNKIYIFDLHGDTMKKDEGPDGGKDENVFQIMKGVSIMLAVKTRDVQTHDSLAEVFHAEIYGRRNSKFDALNNLSRELEMKWSKVKLQAPNYTFVNKDWQLLNKYNENIALDKLFVQSGAGVITARDNFILEDLNQPERLCERINNFNTSIESNEQLCERLGISLKKGWDIDLARKRLRNRAVGVEDLVKMSYRPFDDRWTLYDKSLIWSMSQPTMQHFVGNYNIGIVVPRQAATNEWSHVLLTDKMIDNRYQYSNKGVPSELPLYIYHEDGTRTPNFDTAEHSALTRNLTVEYSPEDILDYIYAVLHSPSYREKYKEFLKTDFPRVPIIESDAEFARFVPLGKRLRELHLMTAADIDDYDTTFPMSGDDMVEKLRYEIDESSRFTSADSSGRVLQEGKLGRVYINDTQYFGSVPDIAWNFYIGGYQPAQKWLKDRKDRKLSSDDIEHYQRIIKVLIETDKTMKLIG